VYLQTSGGNFPNPAVGTYATGQSPTGLVTVALGLSPGRASNDLVAFTPCSPTTPTAAARSRPWW